MDRPFRFGVLVSRFDPAVDLRDLGQRAEALGYSTVLVNDHLVDQPAPLLALLAIANATDSLRVGTLVLNAALRTPLVLARELALLDLLSDGRLEVGLGAGWDEREHCSAGVPFASAGERVALVGELLTALELLWGGGEVSFPGTQVRLDRAQCLPLPLQRPGPPIALPLSGPRMIQLAARHSGIVDIPGRGTSAAETRSRLRYFQMKAGTRVQDVEIAKVLAGVGPDVNRLEPAAGRSWAIEHGASSDLPSILVGGQQTMIDTLLNRREELGISYVIVPAAAMDAFAPLIGELGKE